MGAVEMLICVLFFFLFFSILSISASIRIVPEHKRLDVYRLGRYIGEKGPGLVLLLPFIDRGIMKELGEGPLGSNPSTRLTGVIGHAEGTVYTEGKVRLGSGEVWDAVSPRPISAGQRVRVVRAILEVEEEKEEDIALP